MDKGKKKKILRYVIYGLCFVYTLAILLLPSMLGVEWIVGWPRFLSYALIWFPVCIACVISLLKTLKKPLDKKFTKRKKVLEVLGETLLCAFYIGVSIFWGSSSSLKVDRYISSPNGENKAVVLMYKDEGRLGTEYIYPVRAWLFYEDNNDFYLYPASEDITYNWLDDNTLEITRTREDENGETVTETNQLNW